MSWLTVCSIGKYKAGEIEEHLRTRGEEDWRQMNNMGKAWRMLRKTVTDVKACGELVEDLCFLGNPRQKKKKVASVLCMVGEFVFLLFLCKVSARPFCLILC